MAELLTYTKFQTREDAEWLTRLLERNDIRYIITEEINQIDKIYIGESLDPMIELKVEQGDFPVVSQLLSKQAVLDMQSTQFDHYFNSFDAEDLNDVLDNPLDWNAYDLQVATLLLERKFHTQRTAPEVMQQVFTAEKLEQKWIVMGYLSCLLALIGIFAGLAITSAVKTLQDGTRVHIYDKATLAHGKNMIIIGSVTSFFLFVKVFF